MTALIVAALVIWTIGQRFAGSPVGTRSMLVPVGLTAYGVYSMRAAHFGPIDVTLLAAELVVAIVAGVLRGVTIKLYPRDGHLWQRYSLATLGVWIGLIATRFAFAFAAHHVGATLPFGASVMATFGVSILIETLVVQKRATDLGVPLMPVPDRGAGRRYSRAR